MVPLDPAIILLGKKSPNQNFGKINQSSIVALSNDASTE